MDYETYKSIAGFETEGEEYFNLLEDSYPSLKKLNFFVFKEANLQPFAILNINDIYYLCSPQYPRNSTIFPYFYIVSEPENDLLESTLKFSINLSEIKVPFSLYLGVWDYEAALISSVQTNRNKSYYSKLYLDSKDKNLKTSGIFVFDTVSSNIFLKNNLRDNSNGIILLQINSNDKEEKEIKVLDSYFFLESLDPRKILADAGIQKALLGSTK
jgi:hypothetical protein